MKLKFDPDCDWQYREEIQNFGSAKPKFAFNNLNKIHINWSDVMTDGKGNVLKMPLLTSKQCFGRIEFRYRHEHPDHKKTIWNGKEIDSTNRCIRCPDQTKHSCEMLIAERVASAPGIGAALSNWQAEVDKVMADPFPDHPQKIRSMQFVGAPFRALWREVGHAILYHGRFENSNDAAVKAQIADTERRKREKQVKRMRERREKERAELQAERQPPPKKFVEAAWLECQKRKDQLFAARTLAGTPREISRLTDAGCELTAYAWYYAELDKFEGRPVQAGRIGRRLLDDGLAPGRTYNNLKDRLRRDIERAKQIENGDFGDVWQPFDPDSDLEA